MNQEQQYSVVGRGGKTAALVAAMSALVSAPPRRAPGELTSAPAPPRLFNRQRETQHRLVKRDGYYAAGDGSLRRRHGKSNKHERDRLRASINADRRRNNGRN